jgi:hypothetical protein
MKLNQKNGRGAFTLVEMLVATALVMFIMLILSEAFVAGLEAFRTLKGIGDMEEHIRVAVTPLRHDLRQDHFDGRRRLSDPLFWSSGNPPNPREGFVNVTQGFFPVFSQNAVGQGVQTITPVFPAGSANLVMSSYTWNIQPPLKDAFGNNIPNTGSWLLIDPGPNQEYVQVLATANTNFTANFQSPTGHPAASMIRVIRQLEGHDADGLVLSRATDHVLSLAVKLRGNRQENFFTAHIPAASPFFPFLPGGILNPNYTPTTFFDQAADGRFQDLVPTSNPAGYKTQWAEIAYFLWPNGTSTPNGTPLFALYRAEFKVIPDNRYINGQVFTAPAKPPVPSVPMTFPVNPASLTDPRGPWVAEGFNEMCAGVGSFGNPATSVYQFYNPSDLAGNLATSPPTPPSRVFSNFYNPTVTGWRGAPSSPSPFSPNNPDAWSATLIATDVVSFDVQILSPQIVQLTGVQDFSDVPGGVFDTASSMNNYTVSAVKITLRVWDLKTHQTRQVTVIQDM